jgi:hypothetical protein
MAGEYYTSISLYANSNLIKYKKRRIILQNAIDFVVEACYHSDNNKPLPTAEK